MRVYMAVARNLNHGSQTEDLFDGLAESPALPSHIQRFVQASLVLPRAVMEGTALRPCRRLAG